MELNRNQSGVILIRIAPVFLYDKTECPLLNISTFEIIGIVMEMERDK
ncbi:hypothetical protein QTG56_01010 [Rossellomorea sp. AcN35-11]|nr:hypothetical protein QTG56_01010 [Rossellomorea sp. AcN35-11]